MYGVVIVGHGEVSKGFVNAAEMIIGEQEQLHYCMLETHATFESYLEEVKAIIKTYDEALILADISGGTPSNVGMRLALETNSILIAGVNLPVILEILLKRQADEPLIETVESVMTLFPETIVKTAKEDFKRKGLLTNG